MNLTPSKYFVFTRTILLPLGLTVLSTATIYFLLYSPFFRIIRVTCIQDVDEPCANPHITSTLDQALNSNLFRYDLDSLTDLILNSDPTVRDLSLTKILPGTLELRLYSVYPTLALATVGSDTLFVLDDSLRLIKTTTSSPNVPLVLVQTPLTAQVGTKIGAESLQRDLALALTIFQTFPSGKRLLLTDYTLTLELTPELSAVFTSSRDLSPQLASLQALLKDATIPEWAHTIDLRYSSIVLRPQTSL